MPTKTPPTDTESDADTGAYSWRSERARVASLTRSRAADDPDLIAARARLRAAMAEDHIARIVAAAGPLTDEQCERIGRLLPRPRTGSVQHTVAAVGGVA